MKMEIKELQKKADELVLKSDEKFKCKHTAEVTMLHLMEEIGELAREINAQNMRNREIDVKNLDEEIGDVLILIMRLASCYNLDVEKAVLNKIEILKKRHGLT